MTARRDPDHLIRAFLDDGPTELADRSYDSVRAQIDNTRQRVVLGPWREPYMSNLTRFALAAAAVLVVAIVGVGLLVRPGGIAGPGPTATPTPTASPSPSPSPSPTAPAVLLPAEGDVAAGTYYRFEPGAPGEPAIRVTFTMPAGWNTHGGGFLHKKRDQPGEVMLVPWQLTHIYSDACDWSDTSLVDVRGTPDDLVFALSNQAGREEAPGVWPWEGTVAGCPAKGIALEVPADLNTATCTRGFLRYWPDPGPNFGGGLCCNLPGNTDFVYAVDVNGRTMTVVARHYADSSPTDLAELDAILKSLRLEP
jgi:hypothetical protein